MKPTIFKTMGAVGRSQAIKFAKTAKEKEGAYFKMNKDVWGYAYNCGYETFGGGNVLIKENCNPPE